jgi:uncharacterized membrane protein YccC
MPRHDLRLTQALKRELSVLSLSGPTARVAFRATLASLLSMIVAMTLHLDKPYWAAISAVSIVMPDRSASLTRSLERVLGTIVGAAIGYFGTHFVGDHLIFQLISASAIAFGIYGTERGAHGYAVLLGAVTVVLVMFGSLETPEAGPQLAIDRSIEIVVGVGVTYLVEVALAPASEPGPAPLKPGIFKGPLDEELLANAITGGIAIACIPTIWVSLQLPELGQTPITAFVILSAMRREPSWMALNRAAGCAIGGIYGLFCMGVVGDNIAAWLALLFVGLYVCCHVKHGAGDAAYAGHQAAFGVILAMSQGLAPAPDIFPAVDRFVGIIGGILVVVVAQAVAAPFVARGIAAVLPGAGAGSRLPSGL